MRLKLVIVPVLTLAGLLAISSIVRAAPSPSSATLNIAVGGGGSSVSANGFFPHTITLHAGDTIHFANSYDEPHTVTFVPSGDTYPDLVVPGPSGPPQFGFNPTVAFPSFAPGATPVAFDAAKYYNSGILFEGKSADVSFPKTGTWTFYCVFHGFPDPVTKQLVGMTLNVTVIPASTSGVADSQASLDARAAAERDALITKGTQFASGAVAVDAIQGDGSTKWSLKAGGYADALGQSDLTQFLPSALTVKAGDTVKWTNDTFTPHTITFTSGGPEPELITPIPSSSGPPFLAFNPVVLLPSGGNSYDGTGYVNSGFIDKGASPTNTFSLKFTKPGTYNYICVLHDDQGMKGTITVTGAPAPVQQPSGTPGGTITAPNTGTGGMPQQRDGAWLPALLMLGVAGAAFVLAGTRLMWKREA